MQAAFHFEHEPVGRREAHARRETMRARGEPFEELSLAHEVPRAGLESGNERECRRHPHAATNAEALSALAGRNDVLRLPLQLDDGTGDLATPALLKGFDLEP